MKCLRQMLRIRWYQYITNTELSPNTGTYLLTVVAAEVVERAEATSTIIDCAHAPASFQLRRNRVYNNSAIGCSPFSLNK